MAAELLTVIAAPQPHVEWGWLLGVEFFLNAVATGAFASSALLVLRHRAQGSTRAPALTGAALGLVLICLAPALLLLDLGQPLRFWHLYTMINLRSPLTWGTLFLTSFPALATAHLLALLGRRAALARLTSLVGLPLAVLVQGYTGFVLLLAPGRPLWSSALLPPLFLCSALAAGSGAVLLSMRWAADRSVPAAGANQSGDPGTGLLRRLLLGGTLASLLLSGGMALGLAGGVEREQAALQVLLHGGHGWAALGGVLLLGGAFPLVLAGVPRLASRPVALPAAGGAALVGALLLRLVVLVSGQALPLY